MLEIRRARLQQTARVELPVIEKEPPASLDHQIGTGHRLDDPGPVRPTDSRHAVLTFSRLRVAGDDEDLGPRIETTELLQNAVEDRLVAQVSETE